MDNAPKDHALRERTAAMLRERLARALFLYDAPHEQDIQASILRVYSQFFSEQFSGVSDAQRERYRAALFCDALDQVGHALDSLYREEVEPVCREYFGAAFGDVTRMQGRIAMNEEGLTPELARALAYADGIESALKSFDTIARLEGHCAPIFNRQNSALPALQHVAVKCAPLLDMVFDDEAAAIPRSFQAAGAARPSYNGYRH